ncbi:cell division protein FtsQ [Pelagirhabdus alkalitolerans]|uniref:Cell division protein DivIB n=1 Tax=Pelagirhabdus alkalitolerans TaxID=1612202 RepID=A0A1G6H0Z4_9BACI|nr:FtsQ-type POTRA domain-containing protein [Pelagirhabdus alkalitolerans]SDB87595.1 cell division protein FtsQ [Pelagirhabdus alkalitolerans]
MKEEKVVSIEDRIPKLKEARRKKTNRRLIFYIVLFFFLISIVLYLQSPLSYIDEINVSGYEYINPDRIVTESHLSEEDNIWAISTEEVEHTIASLEEVDSAQVSRRFPNHIEIEIEELDKVAYMNRGEFFYPLLENGTTLAAIRLVDWRGDAPLLYDFQENQYLDLLLEELSSLSPSVMRHISEIHYNATESNPYILKLLMNDGFEVETSIRNFSNNMSSYPSITAQLDHDEQGIIEIGEGGAVFNRYTDDYDQTEDETENEDEE